MMRLSIIVLSFTFFSCLGDEEKGPTEPVGPVLITTSHARTGLTWPDNTWVNADTKWRVHCLVDPENGKRYAQV
jgi:hypothetical protein